MRTFLSGKHCSDRCHLSVTQIAAHIHEEIVMFEVLVAMRSFVLLGLLASPVPFLVHYSLAYLKSRR